MLKIALYEGEKLLQERSVEPGSKMRIGRLEENELVLAHPNVSRYQCVISFDGTSWVIEDLNSMNGFTVEGERKKSHQLRYGDEISIVPFRLVVKDAPGKKPVIDGDATLATPLTEVDSPEEETVMSSTPDFDETDYGSGSEDMTYVGNSSGRYAVSIENGPLKGTTITLSESLMIGRDDSCDLVLDDISVSRKHLQILCDNSDISFRNLSSANVVKLNGTIRDSGVLKHKDIIEIGDSKLQFIDNDAVSANIFGRLIHNKKARIGSGLILLGFFLVVIIFNVFQDPQETGMPGSDDKDATALRVEDTQKTDKELIGKEGLKKEREYQLYYEDGLKLAESGNFQAAVARFRMCLQIKPGDQEATRQLEDIQHRYEEQTRAKEQARKNQQQAIAEATILLERAGEEAQAQDYIAALDLINQALSYENTLDADDVLIGQARDLKEKIQHAQQIFLREKQQTEQDLEKQLEGVKRAYVAGNEAVMNGDFVRARQQWQYAADSELDVKEKELAKAELEKLDIFLAEKSETDYQKGLEAKRKNHYPEALVYFQKVVSVSPGHAQAVKLFDELMAIQLPKARKAYQKGLVYEGINNMEKAKLNWKRVLQLLPLQDNDYYIKAKRKLAQHSL